MTIARIGIAQGGAVPTHSHINEQILNMISGRLKVVLDGVEMVLHGGQTLVIAPNIPHSVEALEDTVAVDVFSPPAKTGSAATTPTCGKRNTDFSCAGQAKAG